MKITNFWQKVSLASISVSLTLSLAEYPVQAAQISFTVSINSGPLYNQSFLGSLNFDELGLTEVGEESLPVSQLTFNFLGSTFTEAGSLMGSPKVAFSDGEFLGLSFSTQDSQVSFLFEPGFFEANQAFFAYEIIASAEPGSGSVTFEQVPFEQVPEPTSVVGLLALSVLGLAVGAKRK